MNNYERGINYENFVAQVYGAILQAESRDGRLQHVSLEKRKTIIGAGGSSNEIDIYWEYEVAGVTYKTAIECKAYSTSKVSVDDLRNFSFKLDNIGGVKGLVVTLNGYESGAKIVARDHSIDLLTIREFQPDDMDGYLQTVVVSIILQSPARTEDIIPVFDGEWMIEQGFEEGQNIRIEELNRDIIVEDRADGFRKSMFELEEERFGGCEVGRGEWVKQFTDGWLTLGERSFKVKAVKVEFAIPQDITSKMEIDLTQHILAIMEHIDQTVGHTNRFLVNRDGSRSLLEDDEV